jgi:hypothetical protein
MDYHFDLKKTVASAPTRGNRARWEGEGFRGQNVAATQEFRRELSYAEDIQDMLA